MPALALAALLALAADPDPPRAAARAVSGRIVAVSAPERSVTVAGPAETAKLTYDRNTMVFLESNPGTVADLAVGLQARASASAAGVAYWIEVARPPTAAASSTATPTSTPTSPSTSTSTATETPTPPAKATGGPERH